MSGERDVVRAFAPSALIATVVFSVCIIYALFGHDRATVWCAPVYPFAGFFPLGSLAFFAGLAGAGGALTFAHR